VVVIPPGYYSIARTIHEEEKPMAKKKAFGGYSISFKGCKDSLETLFGGNPIGPSDMTKKLWSYVKRKKLGKRR